MSDLGDLRKTVEDGFLRVHTRLDGIAEGCKKCSSMISAHEVEIRTLCTESERRQAEASRVSAEAGRITAEMARVDAEVKRANNGVEEVKKIPRSNNNNNVPMPIVIKLIAVLGAVVTLLSAGYIGLRFYEAKLANATAASFDTKKE